MASTYSPLKIELMGTGDQSGTWGVTTNTNLGVAIEEAITGSADVTFASADVTLTLANTNTAQTARNLRLNLIGSITAPQTLYVPAIQKQYIINNTLSEDITVKNATGLGVPVPAGKSMIVFNTGTDVVEVVTALATGTVIPVANGGTGESTASITSFNNITGYTASGATGTTSTNIVFSESPTLTGTPLAPTAAPGTSTTQIATTAFVQNVAGALGTMSSQNADAVAITGGTISGLTAFTAAGVTTLGETTTTSATAATGTINYDVMAQGVLYYTANAIANWTVDFRGNSITTLNSLMAVGETRTVTFLVTQSSSVAYYNSAVTIDGVSVIPKWQGGAAPTSGNIAAVDVYTYSIIKTGSAAFTVFASQTQFS